MAACFAAAPAAAQTVAGSIADLSLEQLSSIEVTTVAKRVQRLADVAGSVYIINAEDIRRSGAATLPEALRLAPNLQVARADANQYAITARGFNSVLANKMLVLVDGRTVYSPLFSGVFWEAQDVVLEDIERIEVLSGASGTLYGSNAVTGVISIITRSAADTQGTLVKAVAGNEERNGAVRYGGAAGDLHYRLYAKRSLRNASRLAAGGAVRDAFRRTHAGFRADGARGDASFMVQGEVYTSTIDQAPAPREVNGAHLMGRYVRDLGSGGRWQLQAYHDRSERDQPGAIRDTLGTWDVEFEHLSRPLPAHELLWGAGWRLQDDRLTNLAPATFALLPTDRRNRLWHLFVQDDFELREKLRVTLGLKAEHNDFTGLELLPNARLAWEFGSNRLLWASASRAVRTPARVDRDFFGLGISGGPNFQSETTQVLEVGLRAQPLPRVSWAMTLFHHEFDRLRSLDAGPGGVTINNNFRGRLKGIETWGQWRLGDTWRLDAGYAWQRLRTEALPGTAPLRGTASLGNDPRYRFKLASSWDLPNRMELDVHLRRVGALPAPVVPAYTTVDLRWGWRARPDLELSLTLRNASGERHVEWGAPAARAEFGRSWLLRALWRM
ncbi:MAG: TonB-dependent receptor [Burkholderiales bacterium]|nr:TonB-dependent receptor [Burkholderiales bacterium]